MSKYNITSESAYSIDIENENGDVSKITIDATDIGQVDALMSLFDFFEDFKSNINKRTNKIGKEYADEKVRIRQTLRVVREEVEKLNSIIDEVFGAGFTEKAFLGKLSINSYLKFFEALQNEFAPAIEKGNKSMLDLIDKYDIEIKDDDVL